jgi:tetratricopeptide (TPR) repeat protein
MDTEAIYQRGFDLRCDGRYADARAEFMKVLEAVPNHADTRWQIGLIQNYEGDFDGSLMTLGAVVRENPRHEGALYDMAMTEMMLGMYDEAKSHFTALLLVNPDHENALRQLAYFP